MRIPARRLGLSGLAIGILAVAGLGLATAGDREPTTLAGSSPDLAAAVEGLATPLDGEPGPDSRAVRRFARSLVHAEITLDHPEVGILTLTLDHGTIRAVGASSVTIAEADGRTVVVMLDDETRVRVGRQPGGLDDLAAGDEIVVRSRLDDGAPLARLIVEIPSGID